MARDVANPLVSTDHDDRWYGQATWRRRAVRAVFDRVALALIGQGRPETVRWIGRAAHALHATACVPPTPEDVAKLFPALTRREATRAARASASTMVRNRAAVASMQVHGFTTLARLVADGAVDGLRVVLGEYRSGVIVLTFHVGAQFGVSAAMQRAGLGVLRLRDLPQGSVDMRARAMKLAVETVRVGGIVAAVADGPGGASSDLVPCLGRRIVLRRGPLVLASITRSAVVPLAARWTDDGRIAVEVGERLGPGSNDSANPEHALATSAAGWLERYLQANPGEIWPYTLRNLLDATTLAEP